MEYIRSGVIQLIQCLRSLRWVMRRFKWKVISYKRYKLYYIANKCCMENMQIKCCGKNFLMYLFQYGNYSDNIAYFTALLCYYSCWLGSKKLKRILLIKASLYPYLTPSWKPLYYWPFLVESFMSSAAETTPVTTSCVHLSISKDLYYMGQAVITNSWDEKKKVHVKRPVSELLTH